VATVSNRFRTTVVDVEVSVRTYVRIYYLVWLTGLGALLYVASLPAAALADVSITQDEDEKVRSKYIDYGPPGEHELGAKKEDDTIQQRESVLAEKSRGKRPDKYKDNANRQDLSSQLNKVEGKPLDSWLLGTKRDQRKEVREKVSEDKDKKKRLSRDLRSNPQFRCWQKPRQRGDQCYVSALRAAFA